MRKFTLLLALLFCMGLVVNAQKTITGTVTSSEDGMTLPGVSVVVKGTTLGTITDIDGKYSIDVPEDAAILVFTYVGMVTEEMEIGANASIDVAMVPDIMGLDEVVVTAIGIPREKKALGYSVQDVSGADIAQSGNANIVNSIGAKVSGVQVTSSSGAAGGSSYIVIRGQASITRDNQPLFVIDGVPIDNSQRYSGNPDDGRNNLNEGVAYSNRAIDINPEDIESMSILKGGAATALYGLRAANGAVIITTKKGSATAGKRLNVNYSASYSFEQVNKLPELQSKYGQGYGGVWYGPETAMSLSWGPLLDTMAWDGTDYKWDRNGQLVSQNDPTAVKNVEAYDNLGTFFRTGHTFSQNVNVSGGSENATFYMSLGNTKTDGIIPNNTFKKTNFKISGQAQLNEKLSINGSINYANSGGDRIQQGSNLSGVMLGLLRTTPSFDNSNGHDDKPWDQEDAYQFEDGTQRSYRGGAVYDNPYWTVNNNPFKDDVDRYFGNIGFNYMANDWLSFTYRLGSDMYNDRRDYAFAIGSNNWPDGQVVQDNHFTRDINSDLLMNIKRDLTTDLKANISLGHNIYEHVYQQIYIQGDQLSIPEFYHISNASNFTEREYFEKKRTAAFFGDLGFSFRDMLFVNATGRQEWSTTLPEDDNAFFYWSFSTGFIFTELPALKDNPILSFGKLRGSFAMIANDATVYSTKDVFIIPAYGDGWTTGVSFPIAGTPGSTYNDGAPNPTIQPEKLKNYEFGADLKFLNNKIGLDIAYYNNQNEELLLNAPASGSSGYLSFYKNAAKMEDSGIEALVYLTPVQTNDFSWDIIVNFTKRENKVIELAEGVENITLGGFTDPGVRVVAGEPYGNIYGSSWLRDDNDNIIIIDDPNAWNYGYPEYSAEERVLGNIQPKWTAGITNTFKFKDLSLSFLIDIKNGGEMWNGTRGALYYFGMHKDTESRDTETKVFDGIKGHWDADGNLVVSGEQNDIEVNLDQGWYIDGEGSGFTGPSEPYVEETSWVRLKELTLSYDLTSALQNTFLRNGVSVYFTGRNLWLSTDYQGVDPETSLYGAHNAQGIDYFNMPNTKSFLFGVRVSF